MENTYQKETKRAIRIAIGISILLLITKFTAYIITGSIAILSDAVESFIHIFAVGFAAFSLWLSQKPPDKTHLYGHDRIGFFSAGFEGAIILLTGLFIFYESITNLISGISLKNLDFGMILISTTAAINGAISYFLITTGKKHHSIILIANGKHLLTDCFTSIGAVVGLALAKTTGWLPFDPITAMIIASGILYSGTKLIHQSISGLMDKTDISIDTTLRNILNRETAKFNISYHELRHRNAGNKLLIEFHLIFPVDVPLFLAHEQASKIENLIQSHFPFQTEIITHLEPKEEETQPQ